MESLLNFIAKIIPYSVGYVFTCAFSFIFIDHIYQELWKEIKEEKKDKDHKLHRWYGGIIGILEGIMYITAFLLGRFEFIGIWLAFKVVGRWERSRIEFKYKSDKGDLGKLQTHAIYSIFTIGNALSIIYAFIGWRIILALKNDCYLEAGFFVLSIFIISFAILGFAKKQSVRIKEFKDSLNADS